MFNLNDIFDEQVPNLLGFEAIQVLCDLIPMALTEFVPQELDQRVPEEQDSVPGVAVTEDVEVATPQVIRLAYFKQGAVPIL